MTACVDPGKTETLAVVFAVVDVVDVVEFVEEEEAEEALSLDHNVDSLIIVSPTVLASACEKKQPLATYVPFPLLFWHW